MFRKLFGLKKEEKTSKNPDASKFGVDLEMNYCPRCGDEYRNDITECVGCSVPLISGADKLARLQQKDREFNGRSMEIGENEERVTIKTGKLRDLKPYQVLLAKERIPALIAGESGGCGKG